MDSCEYAHISNVAMYVRRHTNAIVWLIFFVFLSRKTKKRATTSTCMPKVLHIVLGKLWQRIYTLKTAHPWQGCEQILKFWIAEKSLRFALKAAATSAEGVHFRTRVFLPLFTTHSDLLTNYIIFGLYVICLPFCIFISFETFVKFVYKLLLVALAKWQKTKARAVVAAPTAQLQTDTTHLNTFVAVWFSWKNFAKSKIRV